MHRLSPVSSKRLSLCHQGDLRTLAYERWNGYHVLGCSRHLQNQKYVIILDHSQDVVIVDSHLCLLCCIGRPCSGQICECHALLSGVLGQIDTFSEQPFDCTGPSFGRRTKISWLTLGPHPTICRAEGTTTRPLAPAGGRVWHHMTKVPLLSRLQTPSPEAI